MTTESRATPSVTDGDADYTAELVIDGPADTVFEALTSLSGLAGWWTTVDGSGVAGGELRFVFDREDQPCVMQVTAADRPSRVRWTCAGYSPLPDWAGTTVSFEVEPRAEASSVLSFRHVGLTPRLECYNDCKNGWDHFLPSLRDFVETGRGRPFGSASDLDRREQRRMRNEAGRATGAAATT